MPEFTAPDPQTGGRPVILLGASNLTRDFPLILRLLQPSIGVPCDIYTALGHGRSYGTWSRLLHRALPGISRCDLWQALPTPDRISEQPLALLTDIGNDLIYGQSVDAIFSWVRLCLDQLQAIDARVTITLLPEFTLAKLSNLRFEMTRRLFFPKNPASLPDLIQKVGELNQRLAELAEDPRIRIVAPQPEWYGFDPIHYRVSQRARLWKTILTSWELENLEQQTVRNRLLDGWYAFTYLPPAVRRRWGKEIRCSQPTRMFADGTRISVY